MWEENWTSVQVFRDCLGSLEIVVTMTNVYYAGIKNSEIEIMMRLHKIPEDQQLDVMRDVAYMADKYSEEKNRG